MDMSSVAVQNLIKLVHKAVALIPEIIALEKKLGKLKNNERDLFLDSIIDSLRLKSKFGVLWEHAEKARQESIESMAKEDEEQKKVNDVVAKVLQDTI